MPGATKENISYLNISTNITFLKGLYSLHLETSRWAEKQL